MMIFSPSLTSLFDLDQLVAQMKALPLTIAVPRYQHIIDSKGTADDVARPGKPGADHLFKAAQTAVELQPPDIGTHPGICHVSL